MFLLSPPERGSGLKFRDRSRKSNGVRLPPERGSGLKYGTERKSQGRHSLPPSGGVD